MDTVNDDSIDLAWIGLYDDLNSWKWTLEDSDFFNAGEEDFRNWNNPGPDNSGERLCVYMFRGIWYTTSCTGSYYPLVCYDGRENASATYIFIPQAQTWTEAQRYCREHHTDLVSIRNEIENQKVQSITTYNDYAWIGLYRTRSWSDQSNSSFTYWSTWQPDTAGSCTVVSFSDSGKWADENCNYAFPFICYSVSSLTSSRQYHFVNESMSWTEAQRYCRQNYTDLATIDNMEEMNRLINTVNGSYNGSAWIGLYDDVNSWRWSLEDNVFYQEGERDFRNWYHEPDNRGGNEMCVFMNYDGNWFDLPCDNILEFICYDGRENATQSYTRINDGKTWSEARRYCRDHYTDLVNVRNQTENQRILEIAGGYQAWIGLYRNRIWSKGQITKYEDWRPAIPNSARQPDNGEHVFSQWGIELCTAVSFSHLGRWTDENCLSSMPFICYNTTCTQSSCTRQYHFVSESKTWTEAQRYCRQNYTDLATIENMEEMNRLIKTVRGTFYGKAWIGLYDDMNSWRWSLDNTALEGGFKSWNVVQPVNLYGQSLCVYMTYNRERWSEDFCSQTRPFVCYDGRANASTSYVYVYQSKTWTEAQSYCREHHTDLVSIRNETENYRVQSLIFDYYTVWIGLYRTRSWSDQSNSSFSNWRTGQPDNAGNSEYCTAVSFSDSGSWTDENCNIALPFICYSALASSRQYHFVSESMSWTEAQRYCRQNYTDLATIDNMEEMNRLINTVNGSYNGSAWIGLYDDVNSWRWSLEDNDFYQEGGRDFRNWYHEPDNSGGRQLCVYLHNDGKWYDMSCDNMLPFVCYSGSVNATESYVRINDRKTWSEARRYCRDHYTDLVNVRNQTENQRILETAGGGVWIGLYRNRIWSNGQITKYEDWRPAIPDSGQQPDNGEYVYGEWGLHHCTAVSFSHLGRWTDENCLSSIPFICYNRTCTQSSCTRQYHFVNESISWTEAQRYCRQNYTDLATIDNMEEMNRLFKRVHRTYYGKAWIGLYDDVNSWRWSLDNVVLDGGFKSWFVQQPVNSYGQSLCVYMSYRGTWSEAPCYYTLPFVCYDGGANANRSYVFVYPSQTWTAAQSYCRKHYTDLVSIRNETENFKLLSLFPYYFSFWIGLYRTRSWSDQSNSSFSNWRTGQPDNAGNSEYCTAVSFSDSGNWTDENCNTALPFICYNASASSRQYHFVNESMSWTEAQRYCRQNYTDLATIENMEEMNRLINTVNGSYNVSAWIGLYDDVNSWRWSLEDNDFYQEGERDFRNWYHEPNNGENELCVYIDSNGNWFDSSCGKYYTFVCYDDRGNASQKYIWVSDYRTWTGAQSYCREKYTDLASVRNETERQQIMNVTRFYRYYGYYGYYGYVWIGLHRNRLWSDQSNSSFTYWLPYTQGVDAQPDNGASVQPLNGAEHCTAVSLQFFGQWTDENCFDSLPFFCYSGFASQVHYRANCVLLSENVF
ncbi:macrophage mannose receptor 1-like [Labeo rohita]|uniref:macrophage mannose receptor 1-like n=1 Tax=Labeo rohita TaxID=84645 RepID=UPI0021E301DF|nr:macrophage mannose receptor 1-like [Labeo rohita]